MFMIFAVMVLSWASLGSGSGHGNCSWVRAKVVAITFPSQLLVTASSVMTVTAPRMCCRCKRVQRQQQRIQQSNNDSNNNSNRNSNSTACTAMSERRSNANIEDSSRSSSSTTTSTDNKPNKQASKQVCNNNSSINNNSTTNKTPATPRTTVVLRCLETGKRMMTLENQNGLTAYSLFA